MNVGVKTIQSSFSHAAPHYNAHAEQQREVLQRLVLLTERYVSPDTSHVLDVGCGTGYLKALTGWNVIGTDLAEGMCLEAGCLQPVFQADMRLLPVAFNSQSLLINALSLQWINEIEQTFGQFYSALKPQGYLALSCYVDDTLCELKKAYEKESMLPPVRHFHAGSHLHDSLLKAGFEIVYADQQRLMRHDESLRDLMRYLKQIGAHMPERKPQGMLTPGRLARLEKHCMSFSDNENTVSSSWEVAYFIAKKPS